MADAVTRVKDVASLQKAIDEKVASIEVDGRIAGLSSLKLPSGTHLRGTGRGAELHFKEGQPGLMLSANHQVAGLRLVTDEAQVALGLADDADDLGALVISDITTVGRVHFEASQARRGDLKLNGIHVEQADARLAAHRPAGFGVEVLLGGLTIYNSSKDSGSLWTVEAQNLSGGSRDRPLKGSGMFVFGGWFIPVDADMSTAPAPTAKGGTIELTLLTTGEVHSDGGIPKGIGNLITGGVFVGSGVHAKKVVNEGTTTTYGPNDMVLDNWGKIDSWVAKSSVTSFGSSGIGFVNFGDIDALNVDAPIETHGLGARGFNLYDGSLKQASFRDITTHGDGAIGVQLSKPFGTITVDGNIVTEGGAGDSLVRGKVVHLEAHGLSLKPGAQGKSITVTGHVVARNAAISDFDFAAPASVIGCIEVGGKQIG